ncbi:unnamed protein product, partial [Mesorhabditis belari]|uniref:NF-kappa-B inhibitor-interacting Ras-like protein n=1 Tax=Mesorhabditis belari TaxID=2138241 RepID=A0AAF3J5X4_9BILA
MVTVSRSHSTQKNANHKVRRHSLGPCCRAPLGRQLSIPYGFAAVKDSAPGAPKCDYLCIEGPSSSLQSPIVFEKVRRGSRSSTSNSSYSLFHSSAGPILSTVGATLSADAPRWMGRGAMRVVVVGAKRCGKTSILRQVACLEDATKMPYMPTLDDTYQVLLEEADRPREILVFHDTAGIPEYGPIELRRPYIQVADAFVLVYSVNDHESFNRMDLLKKFIEKQFGKEKKEVPIVVLGTMCDLPGRKVDADFAQAWAQRERVRLFEVTSTDRSTLVDFVQYLGQRHFHPQKDSLKFSLSKKLKSEKSNPAILMDF